MIVSFAFVALGDAPPVTGVSQLTDRHVVVWCNLDRVREMRPFRVGDMPEGQSPDGDGPDHDGSNHQ